MALSWKSHLARILLGRVLPDREMVRGYLRNVLLAVAASAAGGLLAAFALAALGVAFYTTLLQNGLTTAGALWICALLGLAIAAGLFTAAARALTSIAPALRPVEAEPVAPRRKLARVADSVEDTVQEAAAKSAGIFASAKALTSGFIEGLSEPAAAPAPVERDLAVAKLDATEPPSRRIRNRRRVFEA